MNRHNAKYQFRSLHQPTFNRDSGEIEDTLIEVEDITQDPLFILLAEEGNEDYYTPYT